jgi:hypothetical protein
MSIYLLEKETSVPSKTSPKEEKASLRVCSSVPQARPVNLPENINSIRIAKEEKSVYQQDKKN